jgi:hypothetical protein
LHVVGGIGESLVDLEERHDALLVPEVARRRGAIDVAIHGLLEQDRGEDAVGAEGRRRDDPLAHLVHQVEHLGFRGVGALVNAVELQCLRCRSTTLVECRDESLARPHPLGLLIVRHHTLRSSGHVVPSVVSGR